jgi:two-component system sensor histidine kinase HydH
MFSHKLKWLISLRFIFGLLLLGSTIAYQVGNAFDSFAKPIVLLYGLAGTIILLTSVYGLLLPAISRCQFLFVHVQVGIDTLCVTLIIYITGGYASLFSFLYLVVVIYSSVFVLKRETLLVAAFCSVQFAVLLLLEINGFIDPFGYNSSLVNSALTAEMFDSDGSMLFCCIFKWLSVRSRTAVQGGAGCHGGTLGQGAKPGSSRRDGCRACP